MSDTEMEHASRSPATGSDTESGSGVAAPIPAPDSLGALREAAQRFQTAIRGMNGLAGAQQYDMSRNFPASTTGTGRDAADDDYDATMRFIDEGEREAAAAAQRQADAAAAAAQAAAQAAAEEAAAQPAAQAAAAAQRQADAAAARATGRKRPAAGDNQGGVGAAAGDDQGGEGAADENVVMAGTQEAAEAAADAASQRAPKFARMGGGAVLPDLDLPPPSAGRRRR